MTLGEYMLEADMHYRTSPEGQLAAKRQGWLEDAELTTEEWDAKYGATKN